MPPEERSTQAPSADAKRIYVVSHGWHTGVVVPASAIVPGLWPERADFPHAEYLEVGWGDRDFYMAPGFDLGLALKALAWPSASVLHVVGFRTSVRRNFPQSEVIELALSRGQLEALVRFIAGSHARTGGERAAPLAHGLYGDSRFYPAREPFHLFRTCNVWTARALQAAGFPIRAFLALSAGSVMSQIAPFGQDAGAAHDADDTKIPEGKAALGAAALRMRLARPSGNP